MEIHAGKYTDLVERLAHFDPNAQSLDETLALFEEARADHPVSYSDRLGGFYTLLRYDDVKEAHRDWETFSTEPMVSRPVTERPKAPPLEYDPPVHGPWRNLIQEGINPKTPSRIEDALRKDVVALIDGFASSGTCDLIEDLAAKVPVLAACHVLGVEPEKGPEFQKLTTDVVATLGDPSKSPESWMALAQWAITEVVSRRANPRDDYLTALASAQIEGQPLTDMEISMTVFTVLSAGHDTTVNSLGSLLFEVWSRPAVRQQLVERQELISAAINESLRLHPPFIGFFRRTTRDTEIGGVEIPEGASVFLCWASANRDPDVFDDPLEFRLDRPRGAKQHLTFGYGIHACPGQPAARMELRITVEELLRRLPDLELSDPGSVRYEWMGGDNFAIKSLPARFTPAP